MTAINAEKQKRIKDKAAFGADEFTDVTGPTAYERWQAAQKILQDPNVSQVERMRAEQLAAKMEREFTGEVDKGPQADPNDPRNFEDRALEQQEERVAAEKAEKQSISDSLWGPVDMSEFDEDSAGNTYTVVDGTEYKGQPGSNVMEAENGDQIITSKDGKKHHIKGDGKGNTIVTTADNTTVQVNPEQKKGIEKFLHEYLGIDKLGMTQAFGRYILSRALGMTHKQAGVSALRHATGSTDARKREATRVKENKERKAPNLSLIHI